MGVTPGNDQNWGWGKIEANRNFCNKLWNVARYIEDKVGDNYKRVNDPKSSSIADDWILAVLHQNISILGDDIENLRFSEAYERLYHFVWDDFADWYIEASKAEPNHEVLAYCLESILKIAHPFAPFVTETIWQTLGWEQDSILATAPWPESKHFPKDATVEFIEIQKIVTEIRSIKSALGISSKLGLHYQGKLTHEQIKLLKQLARLSEVTEGGQGIRLLAGSKELTCWLDIDAETAKRYIENLVDQQAEAAETILKLGVRLDNKSYVEHAPEAVVSESRLQLEEARTKLEAI
jgi:valyl-tRNA synthetase